MFKKQAFSPEQRKFIRLDSVFPVEFRFLSLDEKSPLSDWLQGFTRNIGKGGICLEINNLPAQSAKLLKDSQAKLGLKIEIPVAGEPIAALACVVWVKDIAEIPDRYAVGLNYEKIDRKQNNKIVRYARTKKFFVPLAVTAICLFFIGTISDSYINMKLSRDNKIIIEQLVRIIRESNFAKQREKEINRDKAGLESMIRDLGINIQTLEKEKKSLEEDAQSKESINAKKIRDLNTQVEKLTREKENLQEGLGALKEKEKNTAGELLQLDKKRAALEKANFDKMYHWLVIHQNPRTGLVMSFEGDHEIADWAFIYDQSLVAQSYLLFSDPGRAKKILEFFSKKAKKSSEGLFFNAYYVNDGSPAEYIIHSGPNIWLGIAALQYTQKTQDKAYLDLAEEIAGSIIWLENQDEEGGLRGGPNVSWYSTEHNLDAYAFFQMLYKLTGRKQYAEARERLLHWLILHAYDRTDVPVKRGKGDSTIATDTYAWSIAAIGPQRLEELKMNPDRIMEFAETNCSVEVNYLRPEGKTVKIKGFDFAPQRHVSRGGVVSCEWTAQMIISFRMMADYYDKKNSADKCRFYQEKVNEYLLSLGKMIISSPSPSGQGDSCLPYASQENVDTGHGWMTPKGRSTGSVAGTAYTLFSYYNYNPLKFKE